MAASVKVVAGLPGWPRLAALFVVGIGLCFVLYGLAQVLPAVAQVIIVLLLIAGLAVALSFGEQRIGRACLEAIAIGAGLTAAYAGWPISWAVRSQSGLSSAVLQVILFLAAVSVLSVLIRLAGLGLVRWLFRRIVVQTGSLCRTCDYDLTGNVSGVCPECGTAIEDENTSRADTTTSTT